MAYGPPSYIPGFEISVLRQLLNSATGNYEVLISDIYRVQGKRRCEYYKIVSEQCLEGFLGNFPQIFDVYFDGEETYVSPKTSLTLCAAYSSRDRSCENPSCSGLHVCKFYVLSGGCPYGRNCRFGHNLGTPHNRQLLIKYRLVDLSQRELQCLFCLPWVRRGVLVPKVCMFHSTDTGCFKSEYCRFMHLCKYFVVGQCMRGEQCPRNHDINHHQVKEVLTIYGFKVTGQPPTAILEEVRAFVTGHYDDAYSNDEDDEDRRHRQRSPSTGRCPPVEFESRGDTYQISDQMPQCTTHESLHRAAPPVSPVGTVPPSRAFSQRGLHERVSEDSACSEAEDFGNDAFDHSVRHANVPTHRSWNYHADAVRADGSSSPRDTHQGYHRANEQCGSCRNTRRQNGANTERKLRYGHPRSTVGTRQSLSSASPLLCSSETQHVADDGTSTCRTRSDHRMDSGSTHNAAIFTVNAASRLDPDSLFPTTIERFTPGRSADQMVHHFDRRAQVSQTNYSRAASSFLRAVREFSSRDLFEMASDRTDDSPLREERDSAEGRSQSRTSRYHLSPATHFDPDWDQQWRVQEELLQSRLQAENERQARRAAEERSREDRQMLENVVSQLISALTESTPPSIRSVENPFGTAAGFGYSHLTAVQRPPMSTSHTSCDPNSCRATSSPFRHPESHERLCPENPSAGSLDSNTSMTS